MEKLSLKTSRKHISTIVFSSKLGELYLCVEEQGVKWSSLYVLVDDALKGNDFIEFLIFGLTSRGANLSFFAFSEKNKTIESALEICEGMAEAKLERNNSLVLAIGGGNATDLVGFAASIYRRGLRFAYVPTTLLAQVDASIGGKTAVNYKDYKNVLGTFTQPEFVFICPALLKSLPMRDFTSGVTEMLKAFIIEDNGNYEKTVEMMKKINIAKDSQSYISDLEGYIQASEGFIHETLEELIYEAVQVKIGLVAKDEKEKGERIKLNLGHTFAHAIEHLATTKGEEITHGEAVSIGLVLAARLSDAIAKQEGREQNIAEKILKDLDLCGLPTVCPYELSELKNAMEEDKKRLKNKIQFVLIDKIGKVYVKPMTTGEALELLAI